jgi:transposase
MEIEFKVTEKKKQILNKYKVIVMHFEGFSYSDIEAATCYRKGTISKLIQKFNEYDDVLYDARSNNSRPPVLSQDDKDLIKERLLSDNRTTLKDLQQEIKEKFNKDVSTFPIYMYEKEIGSFKYPIITPILSDNNKAKRLTFARKHRNDRFSNVLFTDESAFLVFRQTKKVFVMKGDNTPLIGRPNPNYSVMVWGAISRKGKLALKFLEENLNQYSYLDLMESIPEQADEMFGARWRFQHDNAPAHKASRVREWLNDNVPFILDHPPQSPDLNPIEMVWGFMKYRIEERFPSNENELRKTILEAWDEVSLKMINSFIDHLCNTIDHVIDLEGGFTN